jgi:hypothetical protein
MFSSQRNSGLDFTPETRKVAIGWHTRCQTKGYRKQQVSCYPATIPRKGQETGNGLPFRLNHDEEIQ